MLQEYMSTKRMSTKEIQNFLWDLIDFKSLVLI